MSRTIAFVSCVSAKLDEPAAAKDLYTSTWFKKASKYAKSVADQWFILSAEHGLVQPTDVLAPYERTLNTMPVRERRRWAEEVLAEIESEVGRQDRLVFLAGARYREHFVPELRRKGYTVEIPLEGLRIGEQLQRLGQLNRASR
jgi:hypothetical protein